MTTFTSQFRSFAGQDANNNHVDILDARQLHNLLSKSYYDRLQRIQVNGEWIEVQSKHVKHGILYINGLIEITHDGKVNGYPITAIKSTVSKNPILVGFIEDTSTSQDKIKVIELNRLQFDMTKKALLLDVTTSTDDNDSTIFECVYKCQHITYIVSSLPMKFIKVTWDRKSF